MPCTITLNLLSKSTNYLFRKDSDNLFLMLSKRSGITNNNLSTICHTIMQNFGNLWNSATDICYLLDWCIKKLLTLHHMNMQFPCVIKTYTCAITITHLKQQLVVLRGRQYLQVIKLSPLISHKNCCIINSLK